MNPCKIEELQQGGNMSNIGPTYPAHIIVSQAEVRLVADQTSNATTATIKSDQDRIEAAKEVEAAEAKGSSVDFPTYARPGRRDLKQRILALYPLAGRFTPAC